MVPPRNNNMFLVCVTVGLVFLASKYHNNVLRSVKHLYKNIRYRNNYKDKSNCKNANSSSAYKSIENDNNNNNNCKNSNDNADNVNDDGKRQFKITLDKIILADSPEKCDYAVQRIRCDLSEGILGFDCEWVKEGPVSLVQLATFNGVCALFRIGKIGYIPAKLQELLVDKHVLKVGIASFEDGQKIVKDYGCKVNGTLDLRALAVANQTPSLKSLAAMSLEYLSLEMDKIVELRCCDWDASTLSDEQVAYAACDAIASIFIYHEIMLRAKHKCSLWQRFTVYLHKKLNSNMYLQTHGIPAGLIDTRFKGHQSSSLSSSIDNNSKALDINNMMKKNDNVERKNAIPTRNKPLYHNCYLQAPDGEILCTCDRKKAEWYITKGLGTLVGVEPYTVKLNFEPSGRALGEVGKYYTQIKVNQCVVCGCNEKFIRKNVVPREYRKYFPLVMKAHQSHDVLLLCPSCHEISNNNDLQLRRKLADMCDAPLFSLTHERDKYINNCRKLHTAVKVLREGLPIPQRRREELENYIIEYMGQREITPDLLDALNERFKNAPNSQSMSNQYKYQPHGLKVVQYFQKQEGGLVELERMWREHFLTSMGPKYLPNLWSVRHNQERLIMRQAQNRIEPQDAKLAGLMK